MPNSTLSEAADRLAERLVASREPYPNRNPFIGYHYYKLHLTMEAMFEYGQLRDRSEFQNYTLSLLTEGGITPATLIPHHAQPFAGLNYGMFRLTGDYGWLPVYVRESYHLRNEVERTEEGAVIYVSRADPDKKALLIDFMQEYAARLARCGHATGDRRFHAEAIEQLVIHRNLLRDPQTGLWCQGRGWVADDLSALSPGAWSRGQGWTIMGLTETLSCLPNDQHGRDAVRDMLADLVNALLPLQDEAGMWHTLPYLPLSESCPETSGTALIAAALGRIWREKLLDDPAIREAAQRGFAALADYIDEGGNVLATSPGPGTLFEVESYKRRDFPPNDPHGLFSMLFAASEDIRLASHDRAAA